MESEQVQALKNALSETFNTQDSAPSWSCVILVPSTRLKGFPLKAAGICHAVEAFVYTKWCFFFFFFCKLQDSTLYNFTESRGQSKTPKLVLEVWSNGS